MGDLREEKQKANELRKAGKYEAALDIYNRLCVNENDAYISAGMLHCLRKLKRYDEAVVLADQISRKYPEVVWCRTEIIWAYIKGKLDRLRNDTLLSEVKEVANKILQMNPESLPMKIAIFSVLKMAKANNDWKTVNEWISKIDPATLSTTPMINEHGRKGWCDQALWYNYRINGLIESGNTREAINVVDEIIGSFPKQRRFFLRLKGLSYYHVGNLSEADVIYQNLCSGCKTDWWLLYEYAKVKKDTGLKEEALKLMYKAASTCQKLESLVSLFADIGMLCKEMGRYEAARAHISLCKHVRNKKGWFVPESVTNTIKELNEVMKDSNEPTSIQEALQICKNEWRKVLGAEIDSRKPAHKKCKAKKGLIGKVNLDTSARPFCFIITTDKQSFFCYKSDLASGVTDGAEVNFDVVPSFDKKKNRESWKAVNVRIKR